MNASTRQAAHNPVSPALDVVQRRGRMPRVVASAESDHTMHYRPTAQQADGAFCGAQGVEFTGDITRANCRDCLLARRIADSLGL